MKMVSAHLQLSSSEEYRAWLLARFDEYAGLHMNNSFWRPICITIAIFLALVGSHEHRQVEKSHEQFYRSTYLNNSQSAVDQVINGTGTNQGIFRAPAGLSLGNDTLDQIHNYCVMSHAHVSTYQLPKAITNRSVKAELIYLEYVQRHHKRTPYNLFPGGEVDAYDCSDVERYLYAGAKDVSNFRPVQVHGHTYQDSYNPFGKHLGQLLCEFPQLTHGGIEDAVQHGADIRTVYSELLDLTVEQEMDKMFFRSTHSPLTQSTAGAVLRGFLPNASNIILHQQAEMVDSINNGYACIRRDAMTTWYQADPSWQAHLSASQDLLKRLNRIAGSEDEPSWQISYDHFADNFQGRTCNGYRLPCSTVNLTDCVGQEDADEVFRLGDFEWNYYWVTQKNATEYIRLTEGLFISEILRNLANVINGVSQRKLSWTFAHDGDIGPLAGALGIKNLRWPGMGSNIALEVYKTADDQPRHFVRALYGGHTIQSRWGDMDLMAYTDFVSILSQFSAPDDLVSLCNY